MTSFAFASSIYFTLLVFFFLLSLFFFSFPADLVLLLGSCMSIFIKFYFASLRHYNCTI